VKRKKKSNPGNGNIKQKKPSSGKELGLFQSQKGDHTGWRIVMEWSRKGDNGTQYGQREEQGLDNAGLSG